MGYFEILNILEKQLDDIESEHEYIKNKKDKAIKTKDLAQELDLNIRSVRNVIKKMEKRGEVESIKGQFERDKQTLKAIEKATERYYILSQKYMEKKNKWKPKQ